LFLPSQMRVVTGALNARPLRQMRDSACCVLEDFDAASVLGVTREVGATLDLPGPRVTTSGKSSSDESRPSNQCLIPLGGLRTLIFAFSVAFRSKAVACIRWLEFPEDAATGTGGGGGRGKDCSAEKSREIDSVAALKLLRHGWRSGGIGHDSILARCRVQIRLTGSGVQGWAGSGGLCEEGIGVGHVLVWLHVQLWPYLEMCILCFLESVFRRLGAYRVGRGYTPYRWTGQRLGRRAAYRVAIRNGRRAANSRRRDCASRQAERQVEASSPVRAKTLRLGRIDVKTGTLSAKMDGSGATLLVLTVARTRWNQSRSRFDNVAMPAAWLVSVESTLFRPWWLSIRRRRSPNRSLRGAWGRGSLARAAEGFDSRRQTFRFFF
ncbi:hypothetical protein KCU61_g242, partial [Aureobasidium melanogenum]